MKLPGPGLSFVGIFLITNSSSLLVIVLFRLSTYCLVNFGSFYLKIHPFHLGCLICGKTIAYSILFHPFYLCKFGSTVPSYIPDFSCLILVFFKKIFICLFIYFGCAQS